MNRWRRRAGLAAVVVALALTGIGYMDANAVPPSSAGQGSGGVTLTTSSSGVSVSTGSFSIP